MTRVDINTSIVYLLDNVAIVVLIYCGIHKHNSRYTRYYYWWYIHYIMYLSYYYIGTYNCILYYILNIYLYLKLIYQLNWSCGFRLKYLYIMCMCECIHVYKHILVHTYVIIIYNTRNTVHKHQAMIYDFRKVHCVHYVNRTIILCNACLSAWLLNTYLY